MEYRPDDIVMMSATFASFVTFHKVKLGVSINGGNSKIVLDANEHIKLLEATKGIIAEQLIARKIV
jgi:hypothetical protein